MQSDITGKGSLRHQLGQGHIILYILCIYIFMTTPEAYIGRQTAGTGLAFRLAQINIANRSVIIIQTEAMNKIVSFILFVIFLALSLVCLLACIGLGELTIEVFVFV